jgi:hypothetical protein
MNRTPGASLAAIATALLAVLFLVRGISHPGLNYDVIPYVALAKELRNTGGKAEAYREVAAKVGKSRFELYVSGPYREHMYRDDHYFQINQPLYTIRPFYILLCAVVGSLISDDVAATYVISAAATALSVLVSFVFARRAGLKGTWLLAVPLTWIVAGGLNMAGLSTPDGVETLGSLLFVLVSLKEPWTPMRAIALWLLSILIIATRTDGVLFVVFLLGLKGLLQPRERILSGLLILGAMAAYLVIQRLSGNHGYIALLNFALLEERSHQVVPNLVPNWTGYLLYLTHSILQILGENPEFALLTLAVSILAFSWFRERRLQGTPQADAFNRHALVLASACGICLIARFILFPLPWARYVMNIYVLAGILFARALAVELPHEQPKPADGVENAVRDARS